MAIQFESSIDLNGNEILEIADPSTGTSAANKQYVDNVARSLRWKDSVRAASTANVDISSAPSTLDGVTLANGDRVLLKNQTTGSENGIRVFTSAGAALARAVDADSSAEVKAGMAVTVTEGTANGDQVWNLTTNDPITLDTTSLTFSQLGGGATPTAGNSGISVAGTAVSAVAGAGITISSGIAIDTSVVPRKVSANVGNGSLTQIDVTHSLNTRDIDVTVRRSTTPWDEVQVENEALDVNTVRLKFATAPTSAQFRVTVLG